SVTRPSHSRTCLTLRDSLRMVKKFSHLRYERNSTGSVSRRRRQVLQQVDEIVRVFLLDRENFFEHATRRWVAVTEVADHLAIALDRDALGVEIRLGHCAHRFVRVVLGMAAA